VTGAGPLRFVLRGVVEGLMYSLLFCVLGVLTLSLAG
jgi:hypothetical protein